METTTSLKTFEVTIPEKYAEEIHHFAGRQGEGTEEIRIGRGLGGREGRKDTQIREL